MVAPCDLATAEKLHPGVINFGRMPRSRLPVPSRVVGSLNDPYMSVERLRLTARCWGSELMHLGAAGHINIASGFGRWKVGYALLERLESPRERSPFGRSPDARRCSTPVASTRLARPGL
ncbi:RBBP9/YdeN family alpha/beta hydrolase [Sinorhizobium numidicum]|uniref:RBBP9/YdeN family alpha/beta hydrolase n=1 Tax=Sinorhizobium numidicum TaxID=680248 RepID=UPI003CC89840